MEEIKDEKPIVRASRTKRAIAYGIDYMNIIFLSCILMLYFNRYGFINLQIDTQQAFNINNLDDYTINFINILVMVVNFSYYFLQEGPMNGVTIGKRIAKTRAIRLDGDEFNPENAFFRSLCRLIPFEMVSIFFSQNKDCWHDWLTKTAVVDEHTIP